MLVIQLCKTLPEPLNYTLFCDNFFTSTKLFKALRSLGIAACGTAKKGSGFPVKLLALRDVAIKSKHWGLRASTTVDEVLCLGWVDNNTVQLMTTRHHPRELDDSYYLHPLKRHGIPEDSVQPIIPIPYYPLMYAHIILLPDQTPSWPLGLPIPAPVREYNLHMGGSHGNAQQRAVYSYQRRSDRYWWPLFIFLLDAAALNAYKLYLIDDFRTEGKKLTRTDFTHHLALSLMKNPAGQTRRHESKIRIQTNSEPLVSTPEHHYIHLEKKRKCEPCNVNKTRPSKRKGEPLAERDANGRKRKQRGSQTRWACGGCHPIRPCCKNQACWAAIHLN